MLNAVFHNGLQNEFKSFVVAGIIGQVAYVINRVGKTYFFDFQKVLDKLGFLADKNILVPFVQTQTEKFGEIYYQLFDFGLLFDFRHPGDCVQCVVQKVRVYLHLQGVDFQLALRFHILLVFVHKAEQTRQHLVVVAFQLVQLVAVTAYIEHTAPFLEIYGGQLVGQAVNGRDRGLGYTNGQYQDQNEAYRRNCREHDTQRYKALLQLVVVENAYQIPIEVVLIVD